MKNLLRSGLIALLACTFMLMLPGSGSALIETQAPKVAKAKHPSLQGTAWIQTSAEYQGIAKQTYLAARVKLDEALESPSWTASLEQQESNYSNLPPAIIVDVDETVLDNSPFQASLVRDNTEYSDPVWDRWVKNESATPIPGALEFLQYADMKGVRVFYVTNRGAHLKEATRNNLMAEGFPLRDTAAGTLTSDAVLMKGENGWNSDKTSRRLEISREYRILLLFGDDFNDFVSAKKPLVVRESLSRRFGAYFGEKWFVFPNPNYGSWLRALEGEPGNYLRPFEKD